MPYRGGPADRMCIAGLEICRKERYGCGAASYEASTFAGEAVEWIAAMFKGDKLVEIAVSIEPKTFPAIVSGLRQKFGAPTKALREPFNTVGGVKATNEKMEWRSADFSVEAARYEDLIKTGAVRIMTPAWEVESHKASGAKDKARTGNM